MPMPQDAPLWSTQEKAGIPRESERGDLQSIVAIRPCTR